QNISNETMEVKASGNNCEEEDTNQENVFHGESPTFKIHKNWPDVKFERSRNQFECNALCAIRHDLDLVLSTSTAEEVIHHIESARTKTLDRTVVLNIVKEYG
ncbi:12340_t:CDS:2, partial [Dentiscutata erythropus]